MSRIDFERLPDDARLWIFAADRELTAAEQARLLAEADVFIDQWTAHGLPLQAARDVRYKRFLFVGVDERAAGVSGCSVDALGRQMKVLEQELGVELVNHGPVLFRLSDTIDRVSRERFTELAVMGTVTPETTVFDNTLRRVGDLRSGRWETRARNTWHGRAFF
jgi:hypothetical protein